MSNIDKQALREAAEKATPGEWWIDSHGMAMVAHYNDNTFIVFVTDGEQMGRAIRHEDTGNLSHWRNDNDASFIAAANPATVLALLDELEAKEKRIAELEAIAKSVKFDPIPMEDLGNKSDGKKHPYMFGAGYNSAVVHCESVLLQAFAAAAGKGDAS